MSRRSQELRTASVRVTAPPEGRRDEGRRRPSRTRVWVMAVVLTVLVLLVAIAAYAVTFAPEHYARAQAVSADGTTAAEVGGGLQLVPAEGWVVQPLVREIVEWPPLPPLHDWSVLLGESSGVLVLSPDQRLQVEVDVLNPGTERAAGAWLREAGAGSDATSGEGTDAGGGAGSGKDAGSGGGEYAAVRSETLASGLVVQHVEAAGVVAAVVDTGSGWITLRAEAEGGAGARAVGGADADGQPLERYRPALSALLESISAE